jgi:hypothetical protein
VRDGGRDLLDVDAAGRAHHEDRRCVSRSMDEAVDVGLGGDLSAAGTPTHLVHREPVDRQAQDARRDIGRLGGLAASFTPPALRRPPVCTWAFTTTVPPRRRAMASASVGVDATSPSNMGTPAALSSARA